MKKTICIALMAAGSVFAGLRATVETGFLGVMSHTVQFSRAGTAFDYVEEGGQNNLYPVTRLSLEHRINPRHSFILLYQPLELRTSAVFERDVTFNGVEFPDSSAVEMVYGFPFYRVSWLRELYPSDDSLFLGVGLSLQIRNATISFEDKEANSFVIENDIGPVPALKARFRRNFSNSYWVGAEADGMYAPISYLNGSDTDVTGAILDASLRGGYTFEDFPGETFLNLRYIGGGAEGQGDSSGYGSDGYVDNWLHFFNVSVGFSFFLT
ncbi:MAG: hypothetical protein ACQEQ4_11100 [Fibrobacterota bacterium]